MQRSIDRKIQFIYIKKVLLTFWNYSVMAIFQFQKNSLVISPFCLYRFGYCTYDFIVICVEWYKYMQAVFICTCLYYNVFRPFSNVTMKSEKNMPKIFEYNYCLIFKKVYKKKSNEVFFSDKSDILFYLFKV